MAFIASPAAKNVKKTSFETRSRTCIPGKEKNQYVHPMSKTQIKKNEMFILTPHFYIPPICEATQIFLQIKEKNLIIGLLTTSL